MAQKSFFSFSILLLFLHCTNAQPPAAAPVQAPPVVPVQAPPAPPAQSPSGVQVAASPGPLDVVKILGKASHFSVFVRLLKATQVDTELFLQLNNTNNGATFFAPSDGAFSSLKVVSNPVRTLAGAGNRFALNVTTGGNLVNITTGLTNTTISGTVYTDSRVAIYQVDRVLLPLDMFTPKLPAPAPSPAVALAPEKPKRLPL
ncbi:hypothetical protein GH714_002655 [Hevea brasiliensis]|uniref:FAS1 domain-containing protein n=1 Tax=Hevea brasiliensis TaxID=3981 RepID=A0A6A6NBA0_HEVBR|nr:hypothetical protein GH714_002655 [Hevea brasiliensis]